jgi:hypothetical protein
MARSVGVLDLGPIVCNDCLIMRMYVFVTELLLT